MSKDLEYEYNRNNKVWDRNETHTRADALTEGFVGLVAIGSVTAIATGILTARDRAGLKSAATKVRNTFANFVRGTAKPQVSAPDATRKLRAFEKIDLGLREGTDFAAYKKKSQISCLTAQLTSSTLADSVPTTETKQLKRAREAAAKKASDSIVSRYLDTSVVQYPKHPIDWSAGFEAKQTTLRVGRSVPPIFRSGTTQVGKSVEKPDVVTRDKLRRLKIYRNLGQFAETQRPKVTPGIFEVTVPEAVEVTTTKEADITVTSKLTAATGQADLTAATDITAATGQADLTAATGQADLTATESCTLTEGETAKRSFTNKEKQPTTSNKKNRRSKSKSVNDRSTADRLMMTKPNKQQ
ncbi:uncharacterized protein LOC117590888 isoform X2 [Drosophila guanche]|uniref:uncharacterized protein LOC117590888 isoform X2 n=1 Tax=Drosophila guanche TaxID=7266 RepID=UPI0014716C07|nr:uncharacterized protein LOC117590888 isoform X2 [Drosophila guanche]